ncbi:restriction endonuclease [Candidatus Poribacteria bacterium]|nr:restriction endonuclease [Candidatus Poribacteria bacterium]
MGYGGSREDAGKAVGRGGDGGIDGIINEDRLGLDVVYIQAKQWKENVSRPEIQKFAGALQGQRARKGVFITTSGFTKGAEEYVKTIDSKIILIDGNQVAQYMIEHNVGVSVEKTYEIKRVDSDYFAENAENP